MTPTIEEYEKNVFYGKRKDGRYYIKCKLGLWMVEGEDFNFVENEALRYFSQYFSDGEYNRG